MSRRRAAEPVQAARQSASAEPVLLDTGVLVALFDRTDHHHAAASAWMSAHQGPLLTVAPVLCQAAFCLPPRLRSALAELPARGVLQLHHPDASGYARVAQLFLKYADQKPDWADLELVWLAEISGVHRIATLDVADFKVYRIKGRKRFELEWLG
jgi:predicted nucleic acid-binding protein